MSCQHEWVEQIKPAPHGEGFGESKKITSMNEPSKSNFCVHCGAWRGSFGLEPTPQLYISHLVEFCGLLKPILKKSGSLWINLGDTYFGGGSGAGAAIDPNTISFKGNQNIAMPTKSIRNFKSNNPWLQPKQKLLLPHRTAIALQDQGWILRNDVIWHKPNAMPSSVKDRFSNSHESVFFFVKNRRYYFDLDAVREPHSIATKDRLKQDISSQYKNSKANQYFENLPMKGGGSRKEIPQILLQMKEELNPLGKNPSDVYTSDGRNEGTNIGEKGRVVDNQSQWRPKTRLLRLDGKNPSDVFLKQDNVPGPNAPIYKGFNKRWKEKHQKWDRGIKNDSEVIGHSFADWKADEARTTHELGKNPSDFWDFTNRDKSRSEENPMVHHGQGSKTLHINKKKAQELGLPIYDRVTDFWSITTQPFKGAHFAVFPEELVERIIKCACPKGGVVLDPFIGSGTTMLAAKKLGRSCIGAELNPEYCRMVLKRCFEGKGLAVDEYSFEVFKE